MENAKHQGIDLINSQQNYFIILDNFRNSNKMKFEEEKLTTDNNEINNKQKLKESTNSDISNNFVKTLINKSKLQIIKWPKYINDWKM